MLSLAVGTENDSVQLPDDFEKVSPGRAGAFKCEPLEAAYAGSLTRPRLV
jgi:hypothetical protein